MEYEELLEKLEAHLAGEIPLEEARELEAEVGRNPLLAMAHGLFQLQPIAGEQLAASLSSMERDIEETPRFPRLWLLSLLAGSVVIGATGARPKQPTPKGQPAEEAPDQPPGAGK